MVVVLCLHRSKEPGPDFAVICYKTRWGYHFALGNSIGEVVVNPDPELLLRGVDSYRVFRLRDY